MMLRSFACGTLIVPSVTFILSRYLKRGQIALWVEWICKRETEWIWRCKQSCVPSSPARCLSPVRTLSEDTLQPDTWRSGGARHQDESRNRVTEEQEVTQRVWDVCLLFITCASCENTSCLRVNRSDTEKGSHPNEDCHSAGWGLTVCR